MFSHAGFTDSNWGHSPLGNRFFASHATDKTDEDIPKSQSMVAATWQALNDYARQKKCGCKGNWTPDMWPAINEFLNAPGGNATTRRTHSIEAVNPWYLDNKIRILGLTRR